MADFNAKTATPDTDGPTDDNSVLFGADGQAAATPKVYTAGGIKTWIRSFLAGHLPAEASNGSASVGEVGEYLETEVLPGAAVALSSGVAANVAMRSLQPGDWEVSGCVVFAPSAAAATFLAAASSTVSATLPNAPNKGAYTGFNANFLANTQIMSFSPRSYSFSVLTPVYLIGFASFPSGTMSAYGIIRARRAR